MNFIREIDADCVALIDILLPYLILLSFTGGYLFHRFLKKNSSEYEIKKLRNKHHGSHKERI